MKKRAEYIGKEKKKKMLYGTILMYTCITYLQFWGDMYVHSSTKGIIAVCMCYIYGIAYVLQLAQLYFANYT